MAKAPSKRRGITLGARADSATALDLLSTPPAPPGTPAPDETPPARATAGQPDASAAPMTAQLDELRRLNADLDSRWRQQAEQVDRQLLQLEQQRDQIAQQTRALLALEQRRAASTRVGTLLALLAVVGVSALGFHGWPWLRAVAEDVNRVSIGVTALAPQLQTVRGQVLALTSDDGPMDRAVASLREEVAGVRSDLGSLHRAVDNLSEGKGAVQANAGERPSTANTRPHQAKAMANPYWTARPMMPW